MTTKTPESEQPEIRPLADAEVKEITKPKKAKKTNKAKAKKTPLTAEEKQAKKEATKAKAVEKKATEKAEYEASLVGVVIDREITEITGHITSIEFTDMEKFKTGVIDVLDVDGENHTINFEKAILIWSAIYKIDNKGYSSNFTKMTQAEDVQGEIDALIKFEKILTFRVDTKSNVLFGTVSLTYQKKIIENFEPIIREFFGDSEDVSIEITPSTGKYGGKASIQFAQDDMATYGIEVDGGALDGYHSLSIVGKGMVLACSNQMVLDTQKLIKDSLPKLSFGVKNSHTGDIEWILDKLGETVDSIETFRTYISDAKSIILTDKQAKNILSFYVAKKVISRKVADKVFESYKDDEIAQTPGTLWALAMATTWVGTHSEVPAGVAQALKITGGELLIVTSEYDAYLDLIRDTVEAYNEKEEEKE